jgi:hypothetical protein
MKGRTFGKKMSLCIAFSKIKPVSFFKANPAFRGFHHHDSQELLRCFMDQMHEELKQPIRELENETISLDISDQSEAEFETCDSGLSDVSASESGDSSVRKKKIRKSNEERERFRNYKRYDIATAKNCTDMLGRRGLKAFSND